MLEEGWGCLVYAFVGALGGEDYCEEEGPGFFGVVMKMALFVFVVVLDFFGEEGWVHGFVVFI